MEVVPCSPEPDGDEERVLLDALLIAHHRHACLVHRLCADAVGDDRALCGGEIGRLLLAQADAELGAVIASFALRDHWNACTEHAAVRDPLLGALAEEVDRIPERSSVLALLRDNLVRNRSRAARLPAEPGLLHCDVFHAEVSHERSSVASVVGDLIERGRDVYLWRVTRGEGPCS